MEEDDRNKWRKGGWATLISEFIENINQMMAIRVRERIRKEKMIFKKRMGGIFLFFLGMLIFFIGLAILVSSATGLAWSGWIIIGGVLILASLILFKS